MNDPTWMWEYLGEATGTGDDVSGGVRDERATDEHIRGFGRTRNGTAGGWPPDPWRFVRCSWEPELRLPAFEAHQANKMGPEETAHRF